jgi:hypothetical protein
MQTFFKVHRLSGSSVRPLHLLKIKSSIAWQFPMDGGMLPSPTHFDNESSTKLVRLPIDEGNSFTALQFESENRQRSLL